MTTTDKVSLSQAAEETGLSKDVILAARRDGELTEYPGRKYSLDELRALAARPFIARRRMARY